jgi:hypothetical protein
MEMKILIWRAKHTNVYYNASTEEKELAAYLKVFKEMQEQGDYECCPPTGEARALYKLAKQGDGTAVRKFVHSRRHYEYEGTDIEEVIEP